jgi:PBP1b-binding outer membrane lipoprotein LpoB
MTRARIPRVALVVASAVVLTGCSYARVDTADDLCVQYDELVEKVEQIQAVDPNTATVDELRTAAEGVQDELDQVQAVAEGRLDTAISAVRTAVHDFVVAATDAGQEALDAARPQLEDDLEQVAESWARLQELGDVRCGEA